MEDITVGFIEKIEGERVSVGLSMLNNDGKSVRRIINKSEIKFRGGDPPSSLIVINAPLKCRLKDNKILEVNIDSKIEIQVTYGKIIQVDTSRQVVIINLGIEVKDISIGSITYYNNKKIPLQEIQNYIGRGVQVYFNGDACIEGKVLDESCSIKLTLDKFRVGLENQEETQIAIMRDSRLILHYIDANCVFYQQTPHNISTQMIKKLIGKEIIIF